MTHRIGRYSIAMHERGSVDHECAGHQNRRGIPTVTVFDVLFVVLLLMAVITLIVATVAALRRRRARALIILRRLLVCAAAYIGIVYATTALSAARVLRVGDPQCSDDWCLAVDGAARTVKGAVTVYDVKLRIFSRARGRAQRENIATDVYLVDDHWRRYDPVPNPAAVPLNELLQPLQSVQTERVFELPSDVHGVGLIIGHRAGLPICLIIGECGAFHKGTVVRID
jgi:hypothetical protein